MTEVPTGAIAVPHFAPGTDRLRFAAGYPGEPVSGFVVAQWIRSQTGLGSEARHRFASVLIEGYRIDGPIDLTDLAGEGIRAPNLYFSNCHGVTLFGVNSRFGLLSFGHCTLAVLDLTRAEVSGILVLEHCRFALEDDNASYDEAIRLNAAGVHSLSLDHVAIAASRGYGNACDFRNLECETYFDISNSEIFGHCNFQHLRVGTQAAIVNSKFRAASDSFGINLSAARIAGQLHVVDGCEIEGSLYCNNLEAGSHCYLRKVKFAKRGKEDEVIHGEGLRVGGALLFSDVRTDGKILLIHSRIGVNLEFMGGTFSLPGSQVISLHGTHISGDLYLRDDAHFHGELAFTRMKIGGKFMIFKSFLLAPKRRSALLFSRSETGDIDFGSIRIDGWLNLSEARVLGDVKLRGLSFVAPDAPPAKDIYFPAALTLVNTKIDGELRIGAIEAFAIWLADLRGCSSQSFAVLGLNIQSQAGARIDLSGFEYQDIESLSASSIDFILQFLRSLEELRRLHAAEFKKRSGTDAGDMHFNPSAYYHLARVLRNKGWAKEAEQALVEMNRQSRREVPRAQWGRKVSSALYDWLFGYGYSKTKAAITLALWVLVGTAGTQIALSRDALVVDTQVVASTVRRSENEKILQPTLPIAPPDTTLATEPPCRNTIDPFFYAIDLMIPIVDFGQATKCTVRMDEADAARRWWERSSTLWWSAKYIFAIGGWIILSLSVLTFTGSLKDRTES